ALAAGANELVYHSGPALERYPVPAEPDRIERFAHSTENVRYVSEQSQGFLVPVNAEPAQITFELSVPGGAPLAGFDAGGRFLDIRDGEAPDKFTAEVRKTAYAAQVPSGEGTASLAFSFNAEGPY